MAHKRIALLTCLKATGVCSGAGCFKALNDRTRHFDVYRADSVEVVAFFHCNGCEADYDSDSEYAEKMQRVCELAPDAVHLGRCTAMNDAECPVVSRMAETFQAAGITVIRGTH